MRLVFGKYAILLALALAITYPLSVEAARKARPSSQRNNTSAAGKTDTASKNKERVSAATTDTQKSNVDKLRSDVTGIKSDSQVTPEMKTKLATDIQSMAKGATKPSGESVSALSESLSTAMADGNISKVEKAKLMQNIETVMNSANISAEDLQTVINDSRTILEASGVEQSDVETVISDMQKIGAELKTNHPDSTAKTQSKIQNFRNRNK